ncbi:MAG: chorismate-binding protein [Actinobacteria bacterium]|nr:chorismate-binding protein [Actinomycetota bacterium]
MFHHTDRPGFARLARHYPLVPVTRTVSADTETPVSAYLKVAAGPWSFLLESVEGGAHWARYSLVGCDPFLTVEARGRELTVTGDGAVRRYDDPMAALRHIAAEHQMPALPGLPRLNGGLVGYLGFGCARLFERLPEPQPATSALPDIRMFAPRTILAFDNLDSSLTVIVPAHAGDGPGGYDDAQEQIERVLERLARPLPPSVRDPQLGRPPVIRPTIPRGRFEAMVETAKEAVHSGEVVQVVLSQSFSGPTDLDPFAVYRALRVLNPSPYLFHLALGDETLVGASPEVMVRVEDGRALVRPIAGTRPRGATPAQDLALEEELVCDDKERAEHVMLLDLGRNDLGRVAEPGGVSVDRSFEVERYSHVMHLTSTVSAKLRAHTDALDVLAATFPAGTVSGAPKVRALEIIASLEPHERGPYAGAVGYLGFDGSLDTCIAIRTLVFAEGMVTYQAGAGIVADSIAAREYEETLHKGEALRQALILASGGSGLTSERSERAYDTTRPPHPRPTRKVAP